MQYGVLTALARAVEMGWYPEVVSACSSTTVSAYLNWSCCSSGYVCVCCFPPPFPFCFLSQFTEVCFNFHSGAESGPLHCWLTLVAEHLYNLVLLQRKQFCPVLSCYHYLRTCVLVLACVQLHRGLDWGGGLVSSCGAVMGGGEFLLAGELAYSGLVKW